MFINFFLGILVVVIIGLVLSSLLFLERKHYMIAREKNLAKKGITFLSNREWYYESVELNKDKKSVRAIKKPSRQWYLYLAQKE